MGNNGLRVGCDREGSGIAGASDGTVIGRASRLGRRSHGKGRDEACATQQRPFGRTIFRLHLYPYYAREMGYTEKTKNFKYINAQLCRQA